MTYPGFSIWNWFSKTHYFIEFWHFFSWRLWRPSYETKLDLKGKIQMSKLNEFTDDVKSNLMQQKNVNILHYSLYETGLNINLSWFLSNAHVDLRSCNVQTKLSHQHDRRVSPLMLCTWSYIYCNEIFDVPPDPKSPNLKTRNSIIGFAYFLFNIWILDWPLIENN